MEQTKRGFGAWGWFLLIFGLLIFFSNGGFFADGTNVISPAVAEKLNVDQSLILTMNSIAGVIGVLVAIVAGQINQRIGPSKVAAGCLILAGLGHIATGNAVNVPMYLIAMCCVGGGLSAGSFVGIGTLVAMWFPKKQGQAMSVVAMGSNFGTMLFVPLLTVMVGAMGIGTSSMICGLVAVAVGVIGAILLRNTPTERVTASGAVLRFDSQKEARRYDHLTLRQQAGEIHDLRLQVDFTLQEAYTDLEGRRVRAIRYRADFTYRERDGRMVVEDVKSKPTRTREYLIKRKLMKERRGIDITEV